MPSCIVKNCKNRSSQKSFKQEVLEEKVKISFHRLPKKDDKRNLWMKQLGLKQSDLHNDTVVCSIHFKTEDFDKTSLTRIRLQPNAVPSIKVQEEMIKEQIADLLNDHSYSRLRPEQDLNDNADARHSDQNIKKEADNEYSEQNLKDNPDTEHLEQNLKDNSNIERLQKIPRLECPTDTSYLIREEDIKNPDAENLLTILKVKSSTTARVLSNNDKEVQVNVARKDKATCISPERLFHTPEKDQLREHIARMRKEHQAQLKALKQKCKRSTKRIEELKAIINYNEQHFLKSQTSLRQE